MNPTARILTLNAGSSSLRAALYRGDDPPRRTRLDRPEPDLDPILAWAGGVDAIGHRIVHGGPRFVGPERVTPAMVEELRRLAPLDPEHLPAQIALVEACESRLPGVPQIACFDTAFHRDLPAAARLLPIPRRYADQGVRRYGFHGLSYASLLRELERLEGADAAGGRVVLAHLGSGASLAAVRGGRSVDTTMAFTPASGIPMSRRSGDLDPGLVAYLARAEGMTAERWNAMVQTESGLLGLSGTSADARELLAREGSDPRAAEAMEVFCLQARKAVGAMAAALGGLDLLVFSGGIGENSAPVRERICRGLEFLGVVLDTQANEIHAPLLSKPGAPVAVRMIRADEEGEIARSVREILWP